MHTLSVHTDNIVIAQSGLTFLRQATSFYADLFYDPRMSESELLLLRLLVHVHVPGRSTVRTPRQNVLLVLPAIGAVCRGSLFWVGT